MENRNEKTPIKNNWRTIVNQIRRANRSDEKEHRKMKHFILLDHRHRHRGYFYVNGTNLRNRRPHSTN